MLTAREGGTEDKLKHSPITVYKQQIADAQTGARDGATGGGRTGGGQFDLRRDKVDAIVRVMTDPTVISERKATSIAKGILAAFTKPGKAAEPKEETTPTDLATALGKPSDAEGS